MMRWLQLKLKWKNTFRRILKTELRLSRYNEISNSKSNACRVMRKIYLSSAILLLMFVAFLACEKEEKVVLPSIDTASVDEIYNTSARVGGRVTDNGGAEITERGVFWGTSVKPETNGTKLQSGSGSGIFYEDLSGLTPGVKYYVTAYAINSLGTSFGNETFFTTQISLPTVTTSAITEFTPTSARVGGVVTDNGGFEVTQCGVYWGTEPDPRQTGTKLEIVSGDNDFSHMLTGLSREYTYYVIAFATNIKGTSYGEEISFVTGPSRPVVFTAAVSDITAYVATAGGTVISSGGMDITDRGIYWGPTANPLSTGEKLPVGSGTGSFSEILNNLNPGTTYYLTAYAVNSIGSSYGEEKSFLTLGEKPEIVPLDSSDLTANSIVLNVLVRASDVLTTVTFEYGITSSYGSVSEPVYLPVTSQDTTVSVGIAGLTPLTLYHYMIKAENYLGDVNSDDLTFKTVCTGITGSVRDSEGNPYETIGIGYQVWMTENLKALIYRNGIDSIPFIENDTTWSELTTPGCCWYENQAVNSDTYGVLYNWYAVETGNLCPTGWKVPDNEDITTLVEYVGGLVAAGGKLKETGTDYWKSPNTGASDDFDFHARGGGKRSETGICDFVKVEGYWWSSDEYSTLTASYLNILYNYANTFQAYFNKKTGMSVRCIKDQ
jgi:uncharacterized protein (TIGR02145 family)